MHQQGIRRPPMHKEVARRLEAANLNKHCQPGNQLPSERALIGHFRGSRAVIRFPQITSGTSQYYDWHSSLQKRCSAGNAPLAPGRLPTLAELSQLPLFSVTMGFGDPGQPPDFRRADVSRNDRTRFFGQDSWQAFKGFTLSYGASYVYENKLLNHNLDRPALLSPLLNGDLRAVPVDKNNIAPSASFAWNVRRNGKTVIRGGGIFYDSNFFWTRLKARIAATNSPSAASTNFRPTRAARNCCAGWPTVGRSA